MERVSLGGLRPARTLASFVAEVLSGTGLNPEAFWSGFASILRDLGPKNRALLAERDRLQSAIDRWHRDRRGQAFDLDSYEAFLREIGYLPAEPTSVRVESAGIDEEIAHVAGPQLVVPLTTRATRSTRRTRAGAASTTRSTGRT